MARGGKGGGGGGQARGARRRLGSAASKGAPKSARRAAGGGGDPHPSLDIVESRGTELSGKRIVLCVAGSVAAYKAIELARLLMRHGADVTCVASAAATRLVRPDYFRWATGRAAVTKLTGGLEHIRLADRGGSDMIVAYPATANTIGKLANGIDDAPVPTVLTVGLGAGIPIVVGPAMHESMYRNAAVGRNVSFLEKRGVEFVAPAFEEGKARAPEPEEMLRAVTGRLGGSGALRGRRALLTAGPTCEPIDPVRSIASASTGATGMLLARELVSAGCDVTVVYGPGRERPAAGARIIPVTTVLEMDAAVRAEMRKGKFDIVVMAAAAADYTVRSPRASKIKSSARNLTIRLVRAPKIIDSARAAQPGALIVGFKAEAGIGRGELEKRALARMRRAGADMMVANVVGTRRHAREPGSSSASILSAGGKRPRRTGWAPKARIAAAIRAEIEARLEEAGGGRPAKRGAKGRHG